MSEKSVQKAANIAKVGLITLWVIFMCCLISNHMYVIPYIVGVLMASLVLAGFVIGLALIFKKK